MQQFDHKLMEDDSFCLMSYQGDEAEVVIPEIIGKSTKVTILYDDLFKGHAEITSVRIPETVTDIGEFVFDGCANLKHLDLPASLETLWGNSFANSGLEEIVLPEKIRSIPSGAFKNCRNLKRVVCGPNVTKIMGHAFSGCENLKEVIYEPGTKVSPLAFE